jgi:tetratricopeptide (TPR) repeat protein
MRMQPSEGFEGVPMPEGHPSFEREAPGRVVDLPDVVSRLDQTEGLREAPKTFEVALAIASEYANANRAEEAAFYFGQAFEKTAELRALFEKLKGEKAGEACEEVNEGKELELEFAKAKAQKPRAKQAACVRLLLPRVVDAGKKSATFQMLSKDLEGAKKTWEVLLVLDNTLLEASYALGVLLLETEGDNLASLGRSQKLLQGVAGAGHPRASQARGILRRVEAALEAGGNSKVQRPRSEAFMPAGLGFTLPEVAPPSEAEVLKEAERLLAQKQYAQAINRYLGLVDGNQRSARVDAGMAFALARLGTQGEMAQKVWEAAEQTPEVLDGLAQTLKAGGDAEGARWIWGKLSTHPTFGVVARERLKTASP